MGRPTGGRAGVTSKKEWKRRAKRSRDAEVRARARVEEADELRRAAEDRLRTLLPIVGGLAHRMRMAEAEVHFLRLSLASPEIFVRANAADPSYWADMAIARKALRCEAEEWLRAHGNEEWVISLYPPPPAGPGRSRSH
jgi:hypothetical protein